MLNRILILISFCLFSQTLSASLINEMQGCQALLDFVDSKLDAAPKAYAKADVKIVREGLKAYNQYIQNEIVTPGLVTFNGGDKNKAKAMQAQVDSYKAQLVANLEKQYPQAGIKTDQAIAVNECAKKAVPAGTELEALKLALTTMIKLAQTK